MISKPILKVFEKGGHAFAYHEVFDAFLDDMLCRFGAKPHDPRHDEKRELLDELCETYERELKNTDPFIDLLGPIYMELASKGQRQWMGQFFSPWNLCLGMAAMVLQDIEYPDDRLLRMLEPACGSGVMVLACMYLIRRDGGDEALRRWSFTAIDVDRTCVRMAAVQILANLWAHDLAVGELLVKRANSLSLEEYETVVHARAYPRALLAAG